MNLKYFPHFIRKNYTDFKASNDEIMEVGVEFKEYLQDIFKYSMDKLEPIWNIDAKTVIMNQVNNTPFLVNGYHPALIIHFERFIEKVKKEAKQS